VSTKSPIEPNAIYTRQETAHLLSISLSTLKQLIRTGQLRVSQPAGLRRVFIRGTNILEMLEQSERITQPVGHAFGSWTSKTNQNSNSIDLEKSSRPEQTSPRTRSSYSPTKTARAPGGANR
jgi:hypothetical protein